MGKKDFFVSLARTGSGLRFHWSGDPGPGHVPAGSFWWVQPEGETLHCYCLAAQSHRPGVCVCVCHPENFVTPMN